MRTARWSVKVAGWHDGALVGWSAGSVDRMVVASQIVGTVLSVKSVPCSRRTGRLLAAVVLVFACVATLLVLVSRPAPKVADGFAASRLRACGTDAPVAEVSSCLRDGLVLADEVGRLREGVDELTRMVAEDPGLHDACHFASHQAGQMVALRRGDVPALLGEFPDMLCSWGFGHGLLEGFARRERSSAQWRAVAAACDRFAGLTGEASAPWSLCADGFGHAVWDAAVGVPAVRFPSALHGCALLTWAGGLEACVGGVLMQRFRPADRVEGAPASSGFTPEEIVAVCDGEVRDLLAVSPTLAARAAAARSGCAAGVGYVLAMDLLADRVAAAAAVDLEGVVSAALADAEAGCGLFERFADGPDAQVWVSACLGVVVSYVPFEPLRAAGVDAPCTLLSSRWRALCAPVTG